ncbi:Tyrosinase [Arthrobotrys entomopaga]|nr:Tyrosinase [Arthrobotrys entomopaga]
MASWSSLKYALVVTFAFGATQLDAHPLADSSSTKTPHNIITPIAHNSSTPYDPTSLTGLWKPEKDAGPIVVTGVRARAGIAPRKEINKMIENHTEFSLFIMAMYRLQRVPQDSDMSFYAIGGIHGAPFKPWSKVGGITDKQDPDQDPGYCAHGDALFAPWHRPYVALIEQLMWKHASDIVDELPEGDKKAKFRKVLPTLRFPYWDWAQNPVIPREIIALKEIPIESVRRDEERIANPLYSYKFTSVSELEPQWGNYWNTLRETIRFSAEMGPNPSFDTLSQVMSKEGAQWKSDVHKLLLDSEYSFPTMSNELSVVHGAVHQAVGGRFGHMNPVEFSGFDPIFFLHHANVDRLFGIWQTVFPSNYTMTGTTTTRSNFVFVKGHHINMKTDLKPFYQSTGKFWNSESVTDVKTFGYTYPETGMSRGDTIATVKALYGQTSTDIKAALKIKTSGGLPNKQTKRAIAEPKGTVNTKPTAGELAGVVGQIVHDSNKYREWEAFIKVSVGTNPFSVTVFMGEPASADPKDWVNDKNYIGSYSPFTNWKKNTGQKMIGKVSLTSKLLSKVTTKEVESMNPGAVVPYLLKNLKFKGLNLEKSTRRAADIKSFKDLKIEISSTDVTLAKTDSDLPKWGKPENQINWIDVSAGKMQPMEVQSNSTSKIS